MCSFYKISDMQIAFRLDHILGKLLVVFLLFSFIYEIHFAYLPLNFPVMFGLMSFFIYAIDKGVRNKCRSYGWNIIKLINVFIPVLLIAFISIVFNLSWDFYFVKWYIFFVLKVFASMGIMYLAKKYFSDLYYTTLIKIFFCCTTMQIFLSLLMWVMPGIKEILYSTLTVGDIGDEALERTSGLRMNGYGTNFFGSGVVHGFILFLIPLLTQQRLKMAQSTIGIVLYALIFVVSMMMARTTIIGFVMGLFLLMLIKKPKFNTIKLIAYLCISAIVGIVILGNLSLQFLENFEYVITFGFEMFINYFNGDGLTTSSISNSMVNMYIFPDNIFTWLFGDGLWETSRGYYYKGTDIGLCRMLFYFGIIGLAIFLFCYFRLFKIIRGRDSGLPLRCLQLLFVYLIVLQFKGFVDLLPLILPLYFCDPQTRCNHS